MSGLLLACLLALGAVEGPLDYELRVPTEPVLLGEWFEVVVEGELPDSVALLPPSDPGDVLFGRPRAERRGAHRILSLPVALARAGELDLEGLVLAGADVEQALDPIPLTVVYDRPAGFVPIVSERSDAIGLPRPRASTWPFLAAAGIGLLLLGAFTWRAGRTIRVERAPRPAHLVALEELASLRAHLPEDPESVRAMVAEVSGVLRRYIEARFAVHAPSQTTEEFLLALRADDAGAVLGDQRERLTEFLTACDLATYAGVRPGRQGLLDLLGSAEAFVEDTLATSEPEADEPAPAAEVAA